MHDNVRNQTKSFLMLSSLQQDLWQSKLLCQLLLFKNGRAISIIILKRQCSNIALWGNTIVSLCAFKVVPRLPWLLCCGVISELLR